MTYPTGGLPGFVTPVRRRPYPTISASPGAPPAGADVGPLGVGPSVPPRPPNPVGGRGFGPITDADRLALLARLRLGMPGMRVGQRRRFGSTAGLQIPPGQRPRLPSAGIPFGQPGGTGPPPGTFGPPRGLPIVRPR